jgi:hypothetical protein
MNHRNEQSVLQRGRTEVRAEYTYGCKSRADEIVGAHRGAIWSPGLGLTGRELAQHRAIVLTLAVLAAVGDCSGGNRKKST